VVSSDSNEKSDDSLQVQKDGLVFQRLALCGLLTILALIISINVGLTFWLLATLHFDLDGSGPLQYIKGGLHVEGSTQVMGELVTSKLSTRASLLHLLGNRWVLLSSGDSSLTLKHNTELRSRKFSISDSEGSPLLSVGSEGVTMSRGRLVAQAASLGEVLQTSHVRSRVGEDLLLESPTKSLEVLGPSSVLVSSSRSNISIKAHSGLRIKTNTGQILLDSPSVLLPKLPLASSFTHATSPGPDPSVYQVCVCSTGRLFLAPSSSSCMARTAICNET